MARPGISKLSLPPRMLRPSVIMPGFETRNAAFAEDQIRSRILLQTQHRGAWGKRAHALGTILETGDSKHVPETGASSRYRRHHRERIIGNLNWLLSKQNARPSATFSVVRRNWARHPAQLDDFAPCSTIRALRAAIARRAGSTPSGWLFANIEASYDPLKQCYQFHFHGIATGSYVDGVDRLRAMRGFEPWPEERGIPRCKRPVQLKPIDRENMFSQTSYPLKSFWKMRNAGKRSRLPTLEHSRALLFLHRWRLEDLTLLMGVGVSGGRLKPSFRTRDL